MQQIQSGDRVQVTLKLGPMEPVRQYSGTVARIWQRPMWPSGRDVEVALDEPEQWRKDTYGWPAWHGAPVFTRSQIQIQPEPAEA